MNPREERKIRGRLIDDGDCIRWDTDCQSARSRRHPQVYVGGKPLLVRRVVYEMEMGPIRDGYSLIPDCGDECCVKPQHQKQVTVKQKSAIGARQAAKSPNRSATVSATFRASGRAKLSLEIAREIRASDEPDSVFAKRYGVDQKSIWAIRHHETWKDYSNPFAGLGG